MVMMLPVIARAAEVLAVLEKTDRRSDGAAPALDDLPLFAAARPTSPAARPAGPDPLREAIAALNPDDLSPREALEALYTELISGPTPEARKETYAKIQKRLYEYFGIIKLGDVGQIQASRSDIEGFRTFRFPRVYDIWRAK